MINDHAPPRVAVHGMQAVADLERDAGAGRREFSSIGCDDEGWVVDVNLASHVLEIISQD